MQIAGCGGTFERVKQEDLKFKASLDSKKQMHACMCVCIKEHINISTHKLAQEFLLNQ